MNKIKPTFTCPHNGRGCIHVNTSGMTCDVACPDCEIYVENQARLSPGCLRRSIVIAIIILLLSCVTVIAQNSFNINTTLASSCFYDYDTNIWSKYGEPLSVNVVIIVDLDNETIEINNKFEDKFTILSIEDPVSGSNDGDPYTLYFMKVMDKEIKYPIVSITIYESGVVVMQIAYTNMKYKYQGRIQINTESLKI